MTIKEHRVVSRRDLLTQTAPSCVLSCMVPFSLSSHTPRPNMACGQQSAHKFDQPLKTELTYREFSTQRYGSDYIPIMKALYDDIGEDRLLELVRAASYTKNMAHGRSMAQRAPDTSFYTLMQAFRNPNPNALMTNTTVWEVIEDTANLFEIRVSECLGATIFREQEASELGYATICHADYGLPQGFNPDIHLEREKTLMQGHDCCNHRFVYSGSDGEEF